LVFRCFVRGYVKRTICKSNANAASGEISPKVKWRTSLAVRSIGAAAGKQMKTQRTETVKSLDGSS
jgi:hypothetical protein